MLQRLQIAFAEIEAGNISENLLNQVHLVIYYFYQANEITNKVYNNMMDAIQL